MSRYEVDIKFVDGTKVGQFVADNERKMELGDIVDRLNASDELVKAVREHNEARWRGNILEVDRTYDLMIAAADAIAPPKTEAELLEERLKAADVLVETVFDNNYTLYLHQLKAYESAKAAHEAAKS